MALTDETLSKIAFKNLQGKSHTDNNKGLGNEAEGIFLNVAGSEVFIDEIDSNPTNAVNGGVAVYVEADLILDPTSNGHSYFAVYPTPLPPNAPSGVSPGDRVRGSIPASFGVGYGAAPFDVNTDAISVNDPRDWVYQYNSGVFYQQDNVGADPASINLYVYKGRTLSDIDFDNIGNGGSSNSEWQDSVKTKVSDSNLLSPTIGDRFLIIDESSCGNNGTQSCLLNDFIGHDNEIVEWSGTSWAYTTPTDGMTVKIDDEDGYVYHYEATNTNLGWIRYSFGQVRVLNAIGDSDYIGTVNPPIESYRQDIVFLTYFENNNTSGVTIDIDGLGVKDILKVSGSTLVPLEADDVQQGIVYYLTYNGSEFQLASSGSGNAGVIGEAEDGDYTDGLFTDFAPDTPTGTAVDRFNEVLKALSPSPAPDLSDWSATLTGDVNGKLSFDTANPIATYIAADAIGIGISSPVSVDGAWNIGGKRLGVKAIANNITGNLNDQVAQGDGTPTPAYPAKSFGDGEKGSITLSLNGTIVSTIDLTSTTAAIDTTASGTVSGFSVSMIGYSKFPSGAELDLFAYRTGSWLIVNSDVNLTNGYNYIIAEHNTGSQVRTLDRYEFVIDDDNTVTTFSNEGITGLTLTGAVRMSGIEYNTGGTMTYSVDIDNAYRNTYSPSNSAISHTGSTNTYGTLLTAPSNPLGNNSGNEALQINHSVTATLANNIRLIDESVSLDTTVLRTVQATQTGGSASVSEILVDNISSSSNEISSEDFNASETYRLSTNLNYDLVSDIASGTWDSDQSIVDGAAGHTDGLQVTEGKLIYPVTDFTTTNITNSPSFNDGGVGGTARNYTTAVGTRKYVRYFKQSSPTTANFIINVAGSGGTFVSTGTALTGNNIHLKLKCPTQTGWMDCYADFATGNFGDDDGCRSATDGAGRAFNTNWGLTIGTQNTSFSSGNIVVEIEVGASFTGDITGITFTFN